MKYLDAYPDIECWEYEPFRIKYTDDDQRIHHYFPDFYVKFCCGIKEIWEVKPKFKLKEFKNKKEALQKFAFDNNYNYSIITEDQLKDRKIYYNQIKDNLWN